LDRESQGLRFLIDSTRLSAHDAAALGWVDIAVAPIDYHAAVSTSFARSCQGGDLRDRDDQKTPCDAL